MAVTVRTQASFTALVLVLAVALVAIPLLAFDSALRFGLGIALIAAMGAASWRLRGARRVRVAVAVTGSIAALAMGAQIFGAGSDWVVVAHASIIAFVLLVGGNIVVAVWRTSEVTLDTIVGGVAVYLLLAVAWSSAYQLLEFVAPGSFVALAGEVGHWGPWQTSPGTYPRLFFFSFVTLTTLGYGDIIPASVPAAGLAVSEAVTGPLYLAVMIARLVGLHTSSRNTQTGGSEPRG